MRQILAIVGEEGHSFLDTEAVVLDNNKYEEFQ